MSKEDKEPKEPKAPKEPRPLKYRLAPKANGKDRHGLELPGFLDGSVVITNQLLHGPSGEKIIKAIQNWENETGNKVIGELILFH